MVSGLLYDHRPLARNTEEPFCLAKIVFTQQAAPERLHEDLTAEASTLSTQFFRRRNRNHATGDKHKAI